MNFHNIGDIFIVLSTLDAGSEERYCMIVEVQHGCYTIEYFKSVDEDETIFSFYSSTFDRYFKKVSL